MQSTENTACKDMALQHFKSVTGYKLYQSMVLLTFNDRLIGAEIVINTLRLIIDKLVDKRSTQTT